MPSQNPVGPMVRIKDVRAAHGLTMVQLADRIAQQGVTITESGISNVENGNKRPSDRLLIAWAKALDLEPLNVWPGKLRPAVRAGAAPRLKETA